MNAILNETRLWNHGLCDSTIIFSGRFGHIDSKTHILKKECGIGVKEDSFLNQKLLK